MLRLIHHPNSLQEKIEWEGWSRKTASWLTISAEDILNFPMLTIQELTEITLGCYLIKQVLSYTEKHLKEDGSHDLLLHRQSDTILCVKIQSRHTSSKLYNLWIEFNTDGRNTINSWYCQCKACARAVG